MQVVGLSYPKRLSEITAKIDIYLQNNDVVNEEPYTVLLSAWTRDGSNESVDRLYDAAKFGHVCFYFIFLFFFYRFCNA